MAPIRISRRKVLVGVPAALSALALPAWAYWSLAVNGPALGSATTTQIGAPVVSTSGVASDNVTINVTSAPASGPTPTSYRVARTAPSTVTNVCTISGATGSCSDSSPVAGDDNTYQVFGVYSSWEALSSNAPTTTASVPSASGGTVASPTTPNLVASDDTGISSTDDVTSKTTPSFTGTAPLLSTVKLFADGSQVGSVTLSGANTTWTIQASTLTATTHSMTATATVGAATSSASGALPITIDTSAPIVSSIQRAGASAAVNQGPLSWTATFDSPVAGVTISNFAIATSNTGGTAPVKTGSTAVGGGSSAASWTIATSESGTTGADNGSIGLNLTSASGITDVAGNALSGTMPVAGDAYTYDTAGPTIMGISSVDAAGGATDGNLEIGDSLTFTFSEPLASLSTTSVTMTVTHTGNNDSSSNTNINIPGLVADFDTGQDGYGGKKTTQTFPGTLVLSSDKLSVTFTVSSIDACSAGSGGSCSGTPNGGSSAVPGAITPSTSLTDLVGNAATGTFNAVTAIRLF